MATSNLLKRLLDRGDYIAIEQGRLVIRPVSGAAIPVDWLEANSDLLIESIVSIVGIIALRYVSYTRGHYGPKKAAGVTLQFETVGSLKPAYGIFNVELHRKRDGKAGKAGTLLPRNQFRVGRRSHFYRFWMQSGLTIPSRLSSFYDYMGNLSQLLFVGNFSKGERLDVSTLSPMVVGHQQIIDAINMSKLPYSGQASSKQLPHNFQTRMPNKDFAPAQQYQHIQPSQTTGGESYGYTLPGSAGTRGKVVPISASHKRPQEQTIDEWLADYGD